MKNIIKVTLLSLIISSCMSVEEKKKKAEEEGNAMVAIKSKMIKGAGDALKNEGKEAAESTAEGLSEIIKGANKGFDKSISGAKIELDSNTKNILQIGRLDKSIASSSNTTSVYIIAKQDFTGSVKLKAFDQDGIEIGRSTQELQLTNDDAQYFDFSFDQRTPLSQAVKFTLEAKSKE